MGITEVLTLIFVVLKLTHTIDWSWWWVLSPEIIAVGLGILFWMLGLGVAGWGVKSVRTKSRKRQETSLQRYQANILNRR